MRVEKYYLEAYEKQEGDKARDGGRYDYSIRAQGSCLDAPPFFEGEVQEKKHTWKSLPF